MARTQLETSQRILDVAERLVQTRGFNGFSYADIAQALEVTKASLHYHFPSKAELGRRLMERYEAAFAEALRGIDASGGSARAKLERYARIYAGVLRDDRMCLCGMLASDYATLPKAMKEAVKHFFDENERWLAAVLEAGRSAGELEFEGPAQDAARVIVGSLEGAMMLARSYGEPARFDTAAERLLASL
ncbi:MAG TPA: TetR/AcrR family transcriptional regulator [Burkholderiales bacterium]|jgi:TetR/AcrR family transcriptional repressor of nem operon|nr:TetR/AcrR family transcriptional regulator [Burkholderiales bacterium]